MQKEWQFLIKNRIAYNADPDETAHHEQSYLDLHCLQKYLSWSTGLKELNVKQGLARGNIVSNCFKSHL